MYTVKYTLVTAILFLLLTAFKPMENTDPYAKYPVCKGELGVDWSAKKTTFKVWAPKATAVKLRLYDAGNGGTAIKEINLEKFSRMVNGWPRHLIFMPKQLVLTGIAVWWSI
jgi:pullulanase